jgi:3-oxoadipate enol-lactonase
LSTVVLVGSLGSTRAMWEPQLPALAAHDVVAVDHPGHGGELLADVADVRDLAERVLAHVDGRFSVVGLSLGGAVGMRIALDAPERLDRLVLLCTSARFASPEFWHERAASVRERGMESVVDAVLRRWFTHAFADVRRYREMVLSTDAEGYARCCDALARWDVRDELAAVRAPTLVVSGADDPSTPPEHGELLASRIPGARHVVVERAAHLANVERADEVNRLLTEFL